MWNSKLVILDEPTAALGVAQTEQVLALVRRLGEQGLGVVIISHNLHDIFETANRITVLRLGRNVGVFERARRPSRKSSRRSPPASPRRSPASRRPRERPVSTAEAVGPDTPPGGAEGPAARKRDPTTSGRATSASFPIVLGAIVIVIFFGFKATNFFTAGQLRQHHHPDGGHDDARLRRRLRAAAGGDRPLDRLRRGHRRARGGGAPVTRQRRTS